MQTNPVLLVPQLLQITPCNMLREDKYFTLFSSKRVQLLVFS